MQKRRIIIWQSGSAATDINPMVKSLAEGLEPDEGNQLVYRNIQFASEQDCSEKADLVVMAGWRKKQHMLGEGFIERGIPVLVTELGFLKRATGFRNEEAYYQVSLNGICNLPEGKCHHGRFNALKLDFVEAREKDEGPILIVGQVPEDGQHGLSAEELLAWYEKVIADIRKMDKKAEILFRPHPRRRNLQLIPEGVELQDPGKVTVNEAFAGAGVIVTYNSTTGTEALLAGVPVFCSEKAMYAEAACTDLAQMPKGIEAMGDRKAYFYRLAYAQWTHEEMRSGKCWKFWKKQLEI